MSLLHLQRTTLYLHTHTISSSTTSIFPSGESKDILPSMKEGHRHMHWGMYFSTKAAYMMEEGGADVVQMPKQSEKTAA